MLVSRDNRGSLRLFTVIKTQLFGTRQYGFIRVHINNDIPLSSSSECEGSVFLRNNTDPSLLLNYVQAPLKDDEGEPIKSLDELNTSATMCLETLKTERR